MSNDSLVGASAATSEGKLAKKIEADNEGEVGKNGGIEDKESTRQSPSLDLRKVRWF